MNNLLKKILLIILVFSFTNTFAADSSFSTLAAEDIKHGGALLRGEIISSNMEKFPLVWFQYGKDSAQLDRKTVDTVAVSGNYVHSQLIYDLKPNTKYYYQTALKLDGNTQYGSILNFVTLGAAEESHAAPIDYVDTSGNLTLEGMLQQYDAYESYDNKNEINTKTTFVNGKTKKNDSSFSFSNFWGWVTGKDNNDSEDDVVDNSLIHSEEEIAAFQKERVRKMEEMGERRDNNSAAENDELGEIVGYNTNYKNTYNNKNKYEKKYNNSSDLNYSRLLLIVGVLVAFMIVARMFYLKFKRKNKITENLYSEPRTVAKDHHDSRYYIPVDRSRGSQQQRPENSANSGSSESAQPKVQIESEPGTTFFRRPSRK